MQFHACSCRRVAHRSRCAQAPREVNRHSVYDRAAATVASAKSPQAPTSDNSTAMTLESSATLSSALVSPVKSNTSPRTASPVPSQATGVQDHDSAGSTRSEPEPAPQRSSPPAVSSPIQLSEHKTGVAFEDLQTRLQAFKQRTSSRSGREQTV